MEKTVEKSPDKRKPAARKGALRARGPGGAGGEGEAAGGRPGGRGPSGGGGDDHGNGNGNGNGNGKQRDGGHTNGARVAGQDGLLNRHLLAGLRALHRGEFDVRLP